ncbi:hypothetical protein EDF46_1015 [Frondihabitans sp. PhB188]|uniref:DAPG hydrolase family protein n=1 Tax=Frondihabitans sp. PhB188 TaxID=2485200 RepID=UPI000F48FAF5|nr:hypothetical protein [Frondihabitans sp. PhB188]ROQ39389.1 hypothetical protein EDF46_1015 [Frondihabitans sp. PhB188]
MYYNIPKERIETDDPSIIPVKQKLFPEEEAMPLAKYFHNYPLHMPTPVEMQIVNGGPMKVEDAIQPHDFMNLLKPYGYDNVELGYCMFEDGSGYVATYRVRPAHITAEMENWYRNWRNLKSKSMVPGQGNLRYKIWSPADHFDHYYINWENGSQGIHTTESLDLGEGDRMYDTIRHQFDLRDFGFTDEWAQELKDAGATSTGKGSFETFDEPGSHLCLAYSRPAPLGGVETRSREWIGWKPVNGKLVRDETTHCTEEYLRKVVIHTLVEWEHLNTYLPDLYAEYHDQPIDAD